MKNKKVVKFILISAIVYSLITYTIIINNISYDSGFNDGVTATLVAVDSLFIVIPREQPQKDNHPKDKKFEDNKFVLLKNFDFQKSYDIINIYWYSF